MCADYHERRIGLAATHTSMCKISDNSRGVGKKILREIGILAEQALNFSPQDKSPSMQETFPLNDINEERWEEGSVFTTDASDAEVMSTQSDTEGWDPMSRPQHKRHQQPFYERKIDNAFTPLPNPLTCNLCKKIHPLKQCPKVLSGIIPDAVNQPEGRRPLRPYDDSRILLLGEQRRGPNDPLSCGMCNLRNKPPIWKIFDEKSLCSKHRTEQTRFEMMAFKPYQEQEQKRKEKEQRDRELFFGQLGKGNQSFLKTPSSTFGRNDLEPFARKSRPLQGSGSAIRSGSMVEPSWQRLQSPTASGKSPAHSQSIFSPLQPSPNPFQSNNLSTPVSPDLSYRSAISPPLRPNSSPGATTSYDPRCPKSPAPRRGSFTPPLTPSNLSKAMRSHSGSSSLGPSNLDSRSLFSSSTSSSSRQPRR